MYKKIKNSSFMNIFWFILYLLPLLMIIVYSINFYRNDEITINTEDLTYHFDNVSWENYYRIENDGNDDFLLYNNDYNYWYYNTECSFSSGYIMFDLNNISEDYMNKYLYIICDTTGLYECYLNINNNGDFDNFDSYTKMLLFKYTYVDLSQVYQYDSDNYYLYFNVDCDEDFKVYFLLSDNYIFSPTQLYNSYFIDNDNNNSFDVILSSSSESDYATYLQDNFYNTFSHSGIIYNMFINLFSYFGVLNIYIKIISVYLEYIILISLIHLAVDFILLLPNICHKFMEKVGGERD